MVSTKKRGISLRFRLGHKIAAGYIAVTAILAAFAVLSTLYIRDLEANTAALVDDNQRVIGLANDLEKAILDTSSGHRGFLLTGDEGYLTSYHTGSNKIGELVAEISKARTGNTEQLGRLSTISKESAAWRVVANQQIQERRNATDLAAWLTKVNLDAISASLLKINKAVKEIQQGEAELMADRMQQGHDLLSVIDLGTKALPVITVVAGLIAVGSSVRSVTRRMGLVEKAAEQIAAGDLTGADIVVKGTDEAASLARAFNSLKSSLRWLIGETREAALATKNASDYFTGAATEASNAAAQIAEAMGNLSGGAQEQARNVQQANRVMEELSRAVAQIATGAQQQATAMNGVSDQAVMMNSAIESVIEQAQAVLEASRKGADLADGGARAVDATVESMSRIRTTSQQASTQVAELGVRSSQIGTLVADIQAIASQTNLLALNAAIEAARAGDAGRGFAVVAEQVRKLAEDSRVASQQINDLAVAIRQETNEVVAAIAEGEAQAEEGVRLAQGASESLGQILLAVRGTNEAAASIASAAEQLKSQSATVGAGIMSAAAVTEENTAATEQMAAGADSAIQSLQVVSGLASDSAASAEEVSASAEELTATAQEVARAAHGLVDTATRLTEAMAKFRV